MKAASKLNPENSDLLLVILLKVFVYSVLLSFQLIFTLIGPHNYFVRFDYSAPSGGDINLRKDS